MPNHGKDQDVEAAMRILTAPLTGKKKRTEDRLAEEAQKFFAQAWDVPPLSEIAPEDLRPERIYSAQAFLNQIAANAQPLPVLYTAQLCAFLARLGITWPPGVFKHNLASPGSGRKPLSLRVHAAALKIQGKSWGQAAKILLPSEYKANAKAATDKVRQAGTRYITAQRRKN